MLSVSARPAKRRGARRHFFVWQAWFFVAVAIAGFGPSFFAYFAGRMPLPWTAHVHGVVMMGWLFAYAAQTTLVATGRLAAHRAWGRRLLWLAGAVLGVMLMATMTLVARFDPSLTRRTGIYDLFAIQVVSMIWFSIFIAWGVLARGSADWHRRMMTFGTLALLQAAVDRMNWLPDGNVPMYWRSAVRLYLVMLPMIAFDLLTLRRLHRATLACVATIVAGHVFVSAMWGEPGWHRFVHELSALWR